MVLRSKLCGILARFSAQSVSITPTFGLSTARMNPISCQNSRSTGQTCSGDSLTTSQRCVPARSTRAPSTGGTTPCNWLPFGRSWAYSE